MEFSSTLVEHRDNQVVKDKIFPPIDPRIRELERTLSVADKRVDSIKHRLDNMRREYEAAGRIKNNENESILNISLFNNNSAAVESPEVFLSPKKYETDIEKSPTFTARSFKIPSSDECFHVNKSQDSLHVRHNYHYEDDLHEKLSKRDEPLLDKVEDKVIVKKRKIRVVKRSQSKSTTTSKCASTLSREVRKRPPRRRRRRQQRLDNNLSVVQNPEVFISPRKYETNGKVVNETIQNDDDKKEIVELFTNSAAGEKSDQSLLSNASSNTKFKFVIEKPVGSVIERNKNKIIKPVKKNVNNYEPVKNTARIKIKPDGDKGLERKMVKNKIDDCCKELPSTALPPTPIKYNNNNEEEEKKLVASFQRPTFASNAKRHNKCYYTRKYNYNQSIPFVVGTSVNRTHNIGLNIQLALGLMKTHQPSIATSIRPILIKKIERGFVNNLDKDIEDNFEMSLNQLLQNIAQEFPNKIESAAADDDEFKIKNIDINRIKSVMIELHDNFEKLNLKYEKLQQEHQAKKLNNKLEAEMKQLEIELSEKEEEIQQVVNLYKEFMSRATNNQNYSSRTPSTSTRLTALLRKIQSFQQQLISS